MTPDEANAVRREAAIQRSRRIELLSPGEQDNALHRIAAIEPSLVDRVLNELSSEARRLHAIRFYADDSVSTPGRLVAVCETCTPSWHARIEDGHTLDELRRLVAKHSRPADMRSTPPVLVLSELTLNAIQAEAVRAHLRHGDYSMLGSHYSATDRLAILVEEVGEVAHELTYDQGGRGVGRYDKDRLEKELIQVAAMAATWIEQLNGGQQT